MNARDELQKVIHGYFGPTLAINAYKTPEQQDRELADAILAAGWRPPARIIGYVVVDRDGNLIGKQFKNLEAAQAFADEWTADCKTAGIDWDYRVAVITEP
jgi:hypothetical protein